MTRKKAARALSAEAERCLVLARHTARLAARGQLVRDLREKLFGDGARAVTRERAVELLESPGTRYLSPGEFHDFGVPFAEHRASVVRGKPRIAEDRSLIEGHSVTLDWPGGSGVTMEAETVLYDALGEEPARWFQIPDRGADGRLRVHRDTWLGLIVGRAEGIATNFGWSVPEAVLFAMAGERPQLDPVRAEVREIFGEAEKPLRRELVVVVQGHVPAATVRRELAAAQRLLLLKQGRARRGAPLKTRTLRLFEFVEVEVERHAGIRPSWGQLCERWDATHGRTWSYRGHRTRLRGDYLRACDSLGFEPAPAAPKRATPTARR